MGNRRTLTYCVSYRYLVAAIHIIIISSESTKVLNDLFVVQSYCEQLKGREIL